MFFDLFLSVRYAPPALGVQMKTDDFFMSPKVKALLGPYYERWIAKAPEEQAAIIRDALRERESKGLETFSFESIPRPMQRQFERNKAQDKRNRESMVSIVDPLTKLFVKGEGGVVGWTVAIKKPWKRAKVWRAEVVDVLVRDGGAQLFFRESRFTGIHPECVKSKRLTLDIESATSSNKSGSWVNIDYTTGACSDGSRTADGGFAFTCSGYIFTLTPPATSKQT